MNETPNGEGLRYNAGKPRYDLIPISVIFAQLMHVMNDAETIEEHKLYVTNILSHLADFQEGGGVECIERAIRECSWLAHTRNPTNFPALDACAEVFEYGQQKYSPWNWAKGLGWSGVLACAVRHLLAIYTGEWDDPESGLSHVGHVMCNLVMLSTFTDSYPEGDDRPGKLIAAR